MTRKQKRARKLLISLVVLAFVLLLFDGIPKVLSAAIMFVVLLAALLMTFKLGNPYRKK